jgi:trehalose 6-phosphate phosphatase
MIPIDHHALLSDQRGIALLDPLGSVVWLCAPQPDGPPVFGSILDARAGVFSIVPLEGERKEQRYEGDTLIVRTRYQGIELVDFLDVTCERGSRLVRRIEGKGTVLIRFAPRPDLGAQPVTLVADDEGGIQVEGTDVRLIASDPIGFELQEAEGPAGTTHQEISAVVDVDGVLVLELLLGADAAAEDELTRRRTTARHWAQWAKKLTLPSLGAAQARAKDDLVARSALTLRALVHQPTGAILAAGTCSLPETLGGERNWDYRYCWPRDAAYTASALARVGDPSVGVGLLDWLCALHDDLEQADMLEPLYTVRGEHLPGEVLRPELTGYAGSQPVRIGNGAAGQVQLDVFGPVVDLCAVLEEEGVTLEDRHLGFIRELLDAVLRSWDRAGHGVWELRARERDHLYSRGMCWEALTRGAKVLEAHGQDAAGYRDAAERIRAQVNAKGFNEARGAYTMAYGEPALDAAVLKLIGAGLFDSAEREKQTVLAIADELQRGPTVYRYLMEDGLEGEEGGFFICAFWLVDALFAIGEQDRARTLFADLCALSGPLGLYAEEYEPQKKLALGNFPQAYSHLALLDTARRLAPQPR